MPAYKVTCRAVFTLEHFGVEAETAKEAKAIIDDLYASGQYDVTIDAQDEEAGQYLPSLNWESVTIQKASK